MKKLILLLSLTLPVFAQQTKVSPDCTLGPGVVSFAGTGNSTSFDNRPVSSSTGIPCTNWSLTWSAQASVTSLTIKIEAAPDSNGAPGTFAAIASGSTFPSGKVNIATSTGYYPWVRVSVTVVGGTGSITGVLNGWRDNADTIGGGGGGGGGCTAPCVVIGPDAPNSVPSQDPVQVAGFDGTDVQRIATDTSGNTKVVGLSASGASLSGNPVPMANLDANAHIIVPTIGTKSVAVSLSSVSGENQIIAASGSTLVRITHISIGMSGAATVSIDAGTGTNCGTGTSTIWGPYPSNTTGFSLDFDASTLFAPAGNAVCLNFGGTVTAGGGATFAQY